MKKQNWKNYGFEFLSIFIAVIAAFALDNWNENRKDNNTENKILIEVVNGLKEDLNDIRVNKRGHEEGISACQFWRNVMMDNQVSLDSLMQHYFNLTRDYISIQNISGYETLKSRGLELVKDDSLRYAIISLYEYDYNILRKFEEEYMEMQFQENYYAEINRVLAPNFTFDEKGNMTNMEWPVKASQDERKIMLAYLWKIQVNRQFILRFYAEIEREINQVIQKIEKK